MHLYFVEPLFGALGQLQALLRGAGEEASRRVHAEPACAVQ